MHSGTYSVGSGTPVGERVVEVVVVGVVVVVAVVVLIVIGGDHVVHHGLWVVGVLHHGVVVVGLVISIQFCTHDKIGAVSMLFVSV